VLVEDELVLTAYHCLFADMAVEGLDVESFGQPWSGVDAALVAVPGLHGRLAERATEPVSREAELLLFGFGRTHGESLDIRQGSIESFWNDQIYVDAPAFPGDSGGPVFVDEKLVGIVRAKTVDEGTAVIQTLPLTSTW